MTLKPTSCKERFVILDVLRGFALLGVLLANMASHSGFVFISPEQKLALPTASTDHIIDWFLAFLVDGKFYSLFSMLFGIGFALQMQRAHAADLRFESRFRRRLLIMFVFGFLHAILLFVGDILTVYALLGFILMLYRKSSDKMILRSAVVLLLLPFIQYAILWIVFSGKPPAPAPAPGEPDILQIVLGIWAQGSYSEIVGINFMGLYMGRYPDLLFTGRFFKVLAMFLVGFYVAKNMIYADLAGNKTLFKKILKWGAIVGIPCNIALAMVIAKPDFYNFGPLGLIQPAVYAYGVPALCLFYASAVALLFQQQRHRSWLIVFAPMGQMALTNYLMQSLICCFIFMSYGLGLVGKVGPTYLLLIGLAIYIFQLLFSYAWLRVFRIGPMEWLWRSLTYMKWQPFLKKQEIILEQVA